MNYIFPIICIITYYITIIPIMVFNVYYGHYIKLNLIISVKTNYIYYGNYINNILTIISTSDMVFKSLIHGSCSRRWSWTDFWRGRATASSLTNSDRHDTVSPVTTLLPMFPDSSTLSPLSWVTARHGRAGPEFKTLFPTHRKSSEV